MLKYIIYKIFGGTPVIVVWYDSIYDRKNKTTKLSQAVMFCAKQIFEVRIKYKN